MRLVPLLALALIALPAAADSPGAKPSKKPETTYVKGQEVETYRFGATYSILPGDTASACQQACSDDGICVAWSYVSTFEGADARCELKRGGGKAQPNPIATSGISPRIAEAFIPEPKPELEGGPEAE